VHGDTVDDVDGDVANERHRLVSLLGVGLVVVISALVSQILRQFLPT
jgi:hypothetical protein